MGQARILDTWSNPRNQARIDGFKIRSFACSLTDLVTELHDHPGLHRLLHAARQGPTSPLAGRLRQRAAAVLVGMYLQKAGKGQASIRSQQLD